MKKLEYTLANFKNVQDLIKYQDQKTAAILVIVSILISVFLEISKGLEIIEPERLLSTTLTFWNIGCFITGFVFIALAVYIFYICIFQVLKPKFIKKYDDSKNSTFYFGHIADSKLNDFRARISTIKEEEMLNDVTGQLFEVSNILQNKASRCSKAMSYLFCCIVTLILYLFTTIML